MGSKLVGDAATEEVTFVSHVSRPGIGVEDEMGFYTAACSCGCVLGAVPDVETLVDVMMEHVAEMALRERSPLIRDSFDFDGRNGPSD